MNKTHELKCMGHKVSVIIDDEGIEFRGWDEEAEMAVQALGLDPSICWIIAQAIENDELDDLLVDASKNGQAALVALLIDIGADVRAKNDDALLWAADAGHADVVQILLDAGAKVRAGNNYALRWAAKEGHADVVQILLDAGADVHANDDRALRWAARHGHADVVQILEDWIEEHG
jgi:ankyrin repeat protein